MRGVAVGSGRRRAGRLRAACPAVGTSCDAYNACRVAPCYRPHRLLLHRGARFIRIVQHHPRRHARGGCGAVGAGWCGVEVPTRLPLYLVAAALVDPHIIRAAASRMACRLQHPDNCRVPVCMPAVLQDNQTMWDGLQCSSCYDLYLVVVNAVGNSSEAVYGGNSVITLDCARRVGVGVGGCRWCL